jgi:hypothetical protein
MFFIYLNLAPHFLPLNLTTLRADHFHVHIVNANYMGLGAGTTVGQAWLLDDVISLVSAPPLSFFLSRCHS